MVKFMTFEDDNENYNLSFNLFGDKIDSPMFAFYLDGVCTDVWDNEDYLINVLYPYLKDELEDQNIVNELNETFCNVKEIVLELFDEANEMGFFDKDKTLKLI